MRPLVSLPQNDRPHVGDLTVSRCPLEDYRIVRRVTRLTHVASSPLPVPTHEWLVWRGNRFVGRGFRWGQAVELASIDADLVKAEEEIREERDRLPTFW